MAKHAPRTIVFAVRGPIARADLPGLCDRVCALLPPDAVAYCDVSSVPADAVTVDALARLQLAARRRGSVVHLRNPSPQLRDLVGLMGLEDVLVEVER
jgi:ABC-type transporter Mla MlaB component